MQRFKISTVSIFLLKDTGSQPVSMNLQAPKASYAHGAKLNNRS